MAKKLDELWENRTFNQRFPLIGSHTPGDGNGYHDKISFAIPYWRLREEESLKYDHWFYHVYCRNLSNSLNPKYRRYEEEVLRSFNLINCSEKYSETLYKYLNIDNHGYHNNLLNVIEDWGRELVYKGRVVLEFTNWFDNMLNIFYAFELDTIDPNFAKIKKKRIIYSAPFENEEGVVKVKRVVIPKNKCIIIDWPSELGGYKNYIQTVEKVIKLGPKIPTIAETLSEKPGIILQRSRDWELQYSRLLAQWGNSPVFEDSTSFYKQVNNYRFKKTTILLMNSLIGGFKQLIVLLNQQLSENEELQFYNQNYDISIISDSERQWVEGNLSVKESKKILDFS
jgi:hypothetical protein